MLFLAGFSCRLVPSVAVLGALAENVRRVRLPLSFSTLLAGAQMTAAAR